MLTLDLDGLRTAFEAWSVKHGAYDRRQRTCTISRGPMLALVTAEADGDLASEIVGLTVQVSDVPWLRLVERHVLSGRVILTRKAPMRIRQLSANDISIERSQFDLFGWPFDRPLTTISPDELEAALNTVLHDIDAWATPRGALDEMWHRWEAGDNVVADHLLVSCNCFAASEFEAALARVQGRLGDDSLLFGDHARLRHAVCAEFPNAPWCHDTQP